MSGSSRVRATLNSSFVITCARRTDPVQYETTTTPQVAAPIRQSFQAGALDLPRAQRQHPPPVPTSHEHSLARDRLETGCQARCAHAQYQGVAFCLWPTPVAIARWL